MSKRDGQSAPSLAPGRALSADQAVLRETMAGLEMPRAGLRRWLSDDRRFCDGHGGARVYPELLALFAECEAVLDELDAEDAPAGDVARDVARDVID